MFPLETTSGHFLHTAWNVCNPSPFDSRQPISLQRAGRPRRLLVTLAERDHGMEAALSLSLARMGVSEHRRRRR
jgi:hypothetical protein